MDKYAVIGYPLNHSFSPEIHNAAFKSLNIAAVYKKLEIEPSSFLVKIKKLKGSNVLGFNVTIPYKKRIIPFLDNIDDMAKKINAVNTVKQQNGLWTGYNTDINGFIEPLKERSEHFKDILVIGSGGAANAVCYALLKFCKPESLFIANRTKKHADYLAKQLLNETNLNIKTSDLLKVLTYKWNYDLIVNTTSAGMGPLIDINPLEIQQISSPETVVYDLIYNPSETVFLKSAKKLGLKTINGLPMLVGQAKNSFKIWTGFDYPDDISVRQILSKKFSINN